MKLFPEHDVRCLSLTQPWASLVAIGAKRWETRSWPTKYRGRIVIHAAKGYPRYARDFAMDSLVRRARRKTGDRLNPAIQLHERTLPLGCIVAVAELGSCVPTETVIDSLSAEELHFGNYAAGRYAWSFSYISALMEPITCNGHLGLWRLPSDIDDILACRVAGWQNGS